MTKIPRKRVEIHAHNSIVMARQTGRDIARQLGFGSADQTRLATAISELTRNILQYAEKGECFFIDESDDKFRKIKVIFEDNGPGIPDINKAMTDGFTTGKGLGAGLPSTRRLVSEFDIKSEPGFTQITITMVRTRI